MKRIGKLFIIIIYIIAGWLIGTLLYDIFSQQIPVWLLLLSAVSGILAMYVVIILHELGHLVFGLLTGYSFQSFRVFSLMLKKNKDGFCFCRFSLVGTAGQCLMCPPDPVDGKIPYILYNLGGVLMNVFSVVIPSGIYYFFDFGIVISVFLVMLLVFSAVSAMINGIPLQLGEVNNDGSNAIAIGKNPETIRSWWLQLKVNSEVAKEIRLKNMPEEWFSLPDDSDMKDPLIAVEGVLFCGRLLEEHQFERTKQTIHHLLQIDNAIVGVHKGLLICDEIYCMIICGDDKADICKLVDKKQEKFMKAMGTYPSVLRTQYAYNLCVMQNKKKADDINKKFIKVSKSYPYQSEIDNEKELMELATYIQ